MPTFLGPYGFDDYPSNNPNKPIKISLIKISNITPLSQLNLGDTLAINGIVLQVVIKIVTAFQGSSLPTLSVGSNTNPSKYMTELDIDFEKEGIYQKAIYEPIISNEQPRVYWNPLGATAGQLLAFFIFSDP